MMSKFVFLDRDGTINVDYGYVFRKEQLTFCANSIEGLKMLLSNGFKLIVITNQSAVARGYCTYKDVVEFHNYMNDVLKELGVIIERFFFCPHLPHGKVEEYSCECSCRKPGSGLIKEAISMYNIDIANSFIIGDKISDILAGVELGIRGILLSNDCTKYDYVVEDLYQAAKKIVGENYE